MKAENSWTQDSLNLRLHGILEREDVDHTLSGTHHRVTAGLGAQSDRNWDDFIMTLGLRGDHTTDFAYSPRFSSGLSYKLT